MTVRERPEIIAQPVDMVVCEGTPAHFEVDAGVTSGVAYQWQVNMGSGFVNLGDTAGIYSGADCGSPCRSCCPKAGLTATSTG